MFAIFGTFLSSILVGYIVHYTTFYIPDTITTTIPLLDSMLYGSLISSIDPVATLSILGSMGIDTDHVLYVVVFGESILNDGVAIALFDSLKMHLEKSGSHDGGSESGSESVNVQESIQYFIKICAGSVGVGLSVGILCTIYFWLLRGKQTPVMEVGTFFCFAFIAYYSSDGLLGCSGIVSIMTAGFIMDIYVRGYGPRDDENNNGRGDYELGRSSDNFNEISSGDDLYAPLSSSSAITTTSPRYCWSSNFSPITFLSDTRAVFSGAGHMSDRAKIHVGFVADVLANLMETSIFAYLGLFLFSNKKWDDIPLIIIGITSCVLSRVVMIGITSLFVNGGILLKDNASICCRKLYHRLGTNDDEPIPMQQTTHQNQNIFNRNNNDTFYIDRNMQLVMLYSGVRGAVSLALAENIPLYDAVTKNGSSFKPALKAMTSSSIIFTVFFFGASTYFTLKRQRERLNNPGGQTNNIDTTGTSNIDQMNHRSSSTMGGILNNDIFGHQNGQDHDLSLHEELLQNGPTSNTEERYLPPWMSASSAGGMT